MVCMSRETIPHEATDMTDFFDDFNTPVLDRSVWNVDITGDIHNRELQAYIDSPDTLILNPGEQEDANGTLVFQPSFRPGTTSWKGDVFDFVSARINTRSKLELTFGKVSARMRLPALPGCWPAFWLLGRDGIWPSCGELDVMESVGEPDWTNAAVHGPGFYGETPLVNKYFLRPPQTIEDWHVYSMECSPGGLLTFWVDETLIYRVTRPMVEFYGAWVFDQPKYILINLALGGIYPHKTNGVLSPYYGLPAETVAAIRENRVTMAVDWVKIEENPGV